MDNGIKVTKSLLGAQHVSYLCPKCGDGLRSPLAEAGKPDTCPNCNARFTFRGPNTCDKSLRPSRPRNGNDGRKLSNAVRRNSASAKPD